MYLAHNIVVKRNNDMDNSQKLPLSRFTLVFAIISLGLLICYPEQWVAFVAGLALVIAAIFAACNLRDRIKEAKSCSKLNKAH